MSLERWWRLWIPLLIACLATSTLAVGTADAAYQATVVSNETAFQPPCVGFTDSLPAKMLAAAKSAYTRLGYATGAYTTTSFTRARVLSRTANDWGFYVHSHGDYYWHAGDQRRYSGFREDGGDCSQAIVYSKDIAAKRPAGPRTSSSSRPASTATRTPPCPPRSGSRRPRRRGTARSSSSAISARRTTTTNGRSSSGSGTPSPRPPHRPGLRSRCSGRSPTPRSGRTGGARTTPSDSPAPTTRRTACQ